MKVLVTGGAGFIGSHVADGYVDAGHSVVVADDLSRGKRTYVHPEARLVELDIRDESALEALFEQERFDLVNHHAAQIDVRMSVANPAYDADCNLIGLLNLLECCRMHGVERFVFVSSGGVIYGEPQALPVPEIAPKLPSSPYGVSKLASEYYLHYYFSVHGLKYVALRYANVYGPRQDPHGEAGVVAIFLSQLLEGETPTIFGDGEQTRDYVYVSDVVGANLKATAALDDLIGRADRSLDSLGINIGTGRETSVNALYKACATLVGHDHAPQHGEPRAGELLRSALDTERAQRLLGFQSKTSLRQGLERTLAWIADARA